MTTPSRSLSSRQEDARAFCRQFFPWYNEEHHHSGIGFMTPFAVHYGKDQEIYEYRREILRLAYSTHPERFVKKQPEPPKVPEAVWINPPKESKGRQDGGGQGESSRGTAPGELVPSIGRSPENQRTRSVLDNSSSELTEEVMPKLITH